MAASSPHGGRLATRGEGETMKLVLPPVFMLLSTTLMALAWWLGNLRFRGEIGSGRRP